MAQKTPLSFRLIWGILMVIIYVGMFYMLVFTQLFAQYAPVIRYLFGCVFLAYGLFRGWKIISDRK